MEAWKGLIRKMTSNLTFIFVYTYPHIKVTFENGLCSAVLIYYSFRTDGEESKPDFQSSSHTGKQLNTCGSGSPISNLMCIFPGLCLWVSIAFIDQDTFYFSHPLSLLCMVPHSGWEFPVCSLVNWPF